MDNFNDKIRTDIIEKNYYNDIKYNIRCKSVCKFTGDLTENLAYISIGISSIFSFAAGFFDNMYLSFISGLFGVISLSLLKFSSYSMKESKERTEQVNIILKKLGIEDIPDIVIE